MTSSVPAARACQAQYASVIFTPTTASPVHSHARKTSMPVPLASQITRTAQQGHAVCRGTPSSSRKTAASAPTNSRELACLASSNAGLGSQKPTYLPANPTATAVYSPALLAEHSCSIVIPYPLIAMPYHLVNAYSHAAFLHAVRARNRTNTQMGRVSCQRARAASNTCTRCT